jgi:hypothetical protein
VTRGSEVHHKVLEAPGILDRRKMVTWAIWAQCKACETPIGSTVS